MERKISEEQRRDKENFLHRLKGAVYLAGGIFSENVWKAMTLEQVYDHLHPNGIKLHFTLDKKLKDKIY